VSAVNGNLCRRGRGSDINLRPARSSRARSRFRLTVGQPRRL